MSSTLTRYAAAQQDTVTVLLEGYDLAQELGGRISPCRRLDEEQRDLYRRLLPELALHDGDDVTVEDIDEALAAFSIGITHQHRFVVTLSVNGPHARLVVDAGGTPGLGYFGVDRVQYVVQQHGSAEEWQEVEQGDSLWRFAEYAVLRQVEAGQE